MINKRQPTTGFPEMSIITAAQEEQLISQYYADSPLEDKIPIVYLVNEQNGYQWLISEMNPLTSVCYGIIDQNDGKPRTDYIDLKRFSSRRLFKNFFNDTSFRTDYSLLVFKMVALEIGRLSPSTEGLEAEFESARLNSLKQ